MWYSKIAGVLMFVLAGALVATAKVPSNQPSVLIVIVKAEQNRVDALTKYHRDDLLEKLKADRAKAAAVMIRDFRDNFDYCPVYYVVDTNYELLREKKFAGILLDSNLKPLSTVSLNSNSTDYLVANYGKPTLQKNNEDFVEDSIAQKRQDSPYGVGLILYDDKLRQVSYIFKLGMDELFMRRRFGKQYYFKSKNFDLEYYPFATRLNELIKAHPTHIPISRIWD